MLIFVHIPKSGGTSLRAALSAQGKYISLSHNDSFPWMAERSEGATVAAGHIPYGLHNYINEPFEYVTVLRHPVERVMSKYTMPVAKRVESPAEFVKKSSRFQNLATRQLCGLGLNFEDEVTLDHYKLALSNLHNTKYVGTTRNLESLWTRLKYDFGFTGPLHHHLASPNPRKAQGQTHNKLENIKEGVAEAILEYNKWDLKLFKAALNK